VVDEKKEPRVWIIALKLAALAFVIIAGVGLALWYVAKEQRFDNPNKPPDTPASSWGIVNDSPIRPKR
jgi:cytoskeletal protein RodZ